MRLSILFVAMVFVAGCGGRHPVMVTTTYGQDCFITAHDFDRVEHGAEVISRGMDCEVIEGPGSADAPDLLFSVPRASYDRKTGVCYIVVWKPSHQARYDRVERDLVRCAHALRYRAMVGTSDRTGYEP